MTHKSMTKSNRFMRYLGQNLKRTLKVRHLFHNPSTNIRKSHITNTVCDIRKRVFERFIVKR